MPRLKGKKRGARLAVGPKVEVLVPVVRAYQSPLGAAQWLVTLECGHERWVTSAKKPREAHCHACEAKAGGNRRSPKGSDDGGPGK